MFAQKFRTVDASAALVVTACAEATWFCGVDVGVGVGVKCGDWFICGGVRGVLNAPVYTRTELSRCINPYTGILRD